MSEREDVERALPASFAPAPREELLGEDKEQLVERVEALQRELQRRLELEEEILHVKFQKGTASLQAQVEDALRRFRKAQQELEAFRAEILRTESESGGTPRPYAFEDFGGPAAEESDPGQLRSLLSAFRKLRSEKERFQQESDRLRRELQDEKKRKATAAATSEGAPAPEPGPDLKADNDRLQERLAAEQEKAQGKAAEFAQLRDRVADLERQLETARRAGTGLEPAPAGSEGYQLLQKFFKKIRLKELFQKHVPAQKQEGQAEPSTLLVEILSATLEGLGASAVQAPPLDIRRPVKASPLSELRQFMEHLPAAAIRGICRVHDLLRTSLSPLPKKQDSLILDVDSVELVIGTKPRQTQSYYPLNCFVPDLEEFWHGEFCEGPATAPEDILPFLSASLSKTPRSFPKNRLRLRMDARFYSEPVVRLLESKRCGYVVAVPDSRELRSIARSCTFHELSDGWEAGECLQRIHRTRKTQARFVVLRVPVDREARPDSPALFRDPHFGYHVFAVDLETVPWDAFMSYLARRGSVEREHALLRDFSSGRLLARGTRAHAVFFHAYLLASDLLQWFRSRGAPPDAAPSPT